MTRSQDEDSNSRYLFSHNSGGQSPDQVLLGLVSCEDSLPGLQMATYLVCPHVTSSLCMRGERENTGVFSLSFSLFIRTPILSGWASLGRW